MSQAFLFDLDGVIVDSEKEYTRIWDQVGKTFPTGVKDFAIKIKGTTLDDILSTYYPEPETARKVKEKLYKLEGEMKFEVYSGAKILLESLRSLNYPCALVTSSNEDKMNLLWEQHPELRSYFNAIVTAEIVDHSKPDPEGYLKAAELLGMDPKNCAVVEDSLQGVKAGKAAGCFVIGVQGTLPAETLKPYSDIITDTSYSNILL